MGKQSVMREFARDQFWLLHAVPVKRRHAGDTQGSTSCRSFLDLDTRALVVKLRFLFFDTDDNSPKAALVLSLRWLNNGTC